MNDLANVTLSREALANRPTERRVGSSGCSALCLVLALFFRLSSPQLPRAATDLHLTRFASDGDIIRSAARPISVPPSPAWSRVP
jgi:hypothetical protein